MTSPDSESGRKAVQKVAHYLYDPRGGLIAQFELTPWSNPDIAIAIFEELEKIQAAPF